MGGDSSSSSSSSNTTTNTSGSNAVQGDNSGAVISGVNNSTVNVTTTDHGVVDAAESMLSDALNAITSANKESIGAVTDANKDALDAVNKGNDQAFDFAGDALDKVLENNKHTTDSAFDVVNSSVSVSKDLAMQVAANSQNQIKDANELLSDFLDSNETLKSNGETQQVNANTKVMIMFIGVLGLVGVAYALSGKKR